MGSILETILLELYSFPALVSFIVVLSMFWFVLLGRPAFSPPGPQGIPFLGYAPFVGSYPWLTMTKLKESYGKIVGLYLESKFAVVLQDYDVIQTAFVEKGDIFAGRGDSFVLNKMATGKDGHPHGITALEGPKWKDTREFILATLRDLGAGESNQKAEKCILDEVNRLSQKISAHNAWAFDPKVLIRPAMASIMAMVLCSRRFQYEGDEYRVLTRRMPDAAAALGSGALNAFNWLRYIPGRFKRYWDGVAYTVNNIWTFVENEFTSRERDQVLVESNAANYQPKDFVDAYRHHAATDASKSSLAMSIYFREINIRIFAVDEDDFLSSTVTLFMAGTEATSIGHQWLILLMCRNALHQQKIQEEMDKAIGSTRPIGWDDRDLLPLTTATFLECIRLSGLSAGGIPRRNLEKTELMDYKIPKHSLIFANIWAVHYNPKYFPDPLAFKPERFLDDDGNIRVPEQFMPFSIGPRSCPGQELAQMMLFLTFANLVHRFEWKEPKGLTLPRLHEFGPASVAATPAPYKVLAVARFNS